MCKYIYCYYVNCCHCELYRTSYCEKAIALGLPDRDDRWHHDLHGTNQNRTLQPGSLSADRSSVSHSSFGPSQSHSRNTPQGSRNRVPMTTTAPSEADLPHNWAESVATSEYERPHGADYIPRSGQSNLDRCLPYSPASSHVYHQHTSQAISPLDTVRCNSNNGFNMNIALDPYSSFQMELTHQDGKVQEIITRIESLASCNTSDGSLSDGARTDAGDPLPRPSSASIVHYVDPSTEDEAIRGSPALQEEYDDTFTSAKCTGRWRRRADVATCSKSAANTDAKECGGVPTEVDVTPNQKGKGKLRIRHNLERLVDQSHERGPRNQQKSHPEHGTEKSKAPTLATAERAAQRQSRKSISQKNSTAETSHKTVRSTRSVADNCSVHSTEVAAFLTKDAVSPIESSITTPPHSTRRLLQSPSKSSLKSPAGSPLRGSPQQGSTISIKLNKASPTKAPMKESICNLDGPSISTDGIKHTRASASIASTTGATPFVSAHPSPSSLVSFYTAHSRIAESIPDLDLANVDDAQMSTGMKTHSHQNVRGKSESHLKAWTNAGKSALTKPSASKLSLRIPQPYSTSTNRKPPFTLGSTRSSGSVTPASPSTSSRIPRISSNIQGDIEHSSSTLKRVKSAKCLPLSKSVEMNKEEQEALTTRNQDGMYVEQAEDPSTIPPPDIPVAATLHPFNALNSQYLSPIISSGSSRSDDHGEKSSRSWSSLWNDSHPDRATGTDSTIVKVSVDKHSMIENYLEKTANQPEVSSISKAPLNETEPAAPSQHQFPLDLRGAYPHISHPETHQPRTTNRTDSKEAILGSNIHNQTSRVTRIAREVGEATVKAFPADPHPVLNDPSIVYSRAKSDASGTSRSDPHRDEASSVTSRSSTGVSSMSKLQPSASITLEHAQRCIPKEHRQTGSEVSFRSLQSSDLRGDAAIFVPQKLSTAYRPELPKEWVQPCKPTVPFNPFELDVIYGIPLYYHMNHSVNVGDGTAFNYPNYPRHSPFKKGKNKRFYNGTKQSNHRKTRSTDTTLSPAKCYRTGDTGRAVETNEITVRPEEETTPRLLHATLAQSESSATGNMPAEAKSSPPKQSPFAQQMEIISTQVSRNASGTGRGPRHIDWGSIRNVRYNGQREAGYHYQTLPTIEDYTRGYHQHHQNQQQIGKNRTHANGRRGWHRSHDFNPPAGVPLDLTAPFPDPVAPPGPRPAGMNVEGGSPKQYVGYHISETQGCGKFEIEDGIEYGELSTLKCRSCAPDQ